MSNFKQSRYESRHKKKSASGYIITLCVLFGLVAWLIGNRKIDASVAQFMRSGNVHTANQSFIAKGNKIFGLDHTTCTVRYISYTFKNQSSQEIHEQLNSFNADLTLDSLSMDTCNYAFNLDPKHQPVYDEYVSNLGDWVNICDSFFVIIGKIDDGLYENAIYAANVCINAPPKSIAFVIDAGLTKMPLFDLAVRIDDVEEWSGENLFSDIFSAEDEQKIENDLNRLSWTYNPEYYNKRIELNLKLKNEYKQQ